jgi:capsular exopolysaccharide synthesis family protein
MTTIMVTVVIAMELRTPLYEATVKILVSGKMQKDVEVQRELGPGSLVLTQMQLVNSRPIVERSVRALKLYQRPIDYEKKFTTRLNAILIDRKTKKLKLQLDAMTPQERLAFLFRSAIQDLSGKISTGLVKDTSMFFIAIRDFDPRAAALIANIVSRSYIIFDLEQQIAELELIYGRKNETIRKLEKHIERLEETLDGRILPDIEAIGPASVKIVTQAGLGRLRPMKPGKISAYIIAFLMGIVTSIVLAFGFDYFDQTFRSPQDVEKFLNIPFLGSIPKGRARKNYLIKHTNPVTRYNRAYQNLSNQVYLLMKDKNIKSILLTDAEGSKENAAVIANLGIFQAHNTEYKVLIIDADLRSSMLSKIFNISYTTGLANVLEGGISFENAVQSLGSNLDILAAGETDLNPLVLFDSSAMSDVVKKAEEQYEMVFIHCADIKNFTDGVVLSSITDGFILIINEGKVKRHNVKYAIAPIEQKNISITGAIINNYKYVVPEIIYRLT